MDRFRQMFTMLPRTSGMSCGRVPCPLLTATKMAGPSRNKMNSVWYRIIGLSLSLKSYVLEAFVEGRTLYYKYEVL
jgi:hypothetical protein